MPGRKVQKVGQESPGQGAWGKGVWCLLSSPSPQGGDEGGGRQGQRAGGRGWGKEVGSHLLSPGRAVVGWQARSLLPLPAMGKEAEKMFCPGSPGLTWARAGKAVKEAGKGRGHVQRGRRQGQAAAQANV